eukprot:c15331_g1_i1 orf=496-1329(-)
MADADDSPLAMAPPHSQDDVAENAELVLFQVKECYVYLIPPRKSTASYRADEWNINKWDWEGSLKVVSKGEDCTIRLEDNTSGELYAQAPVRGEQPLPIEAVIDSSRFFVLRVEDTSGPQARHAFIGIGFRERTPAYDFQAALHDHVKYVLKKKQAEELVQEYESKPSVDYSLKDGETLRLNLKPSRSTPTPLQSAPSSFFLNQKQDSSQGSMAAGVVASSPVPFLAPPPNPAFPIALVRAASNKLEDRGTESLSSIHSSETQDNVDDDFGDFQAAG